MAGAAWVALQTREEQKSRRNPEFLPTPRQIQTPARRRPIPGIRGRSGTEAEYQAVPATEAASALDSLHGSVVDKGEPGTDLRSPSPRPPEGGSAVGGDERGHDGREGGLPNRGAAEGRLPPGPRSGDPPRRRALRGRGAGPREKDEPVVLRPLPRAMRGAA